jgi:hypothetical protein
MDQASSYDEEHLAPTDEGLQNSLSSSACSTAMATPIFGDTMQLVAPSESNNVMPEETEVEESEKLLQQTLNMYPEGLSAQNTSNPHHHSNSVENMLPHNGTMDSPWTLSSELINTLLVALSPTRKKELELRQQELDLQRELVALKRETMLMKREVLAVQRQALVIQQQEITLKARELALQHQFQQQRHHHQSSRASVDYSETSSP